MRIDYVNFRNAFITFLQSANTATADFDLSQGLSKRVANIGSTDLEIYGPKISEFPFISVTLGQKESELYTQSSAGRVNSEILFNLNIIAVTNSFLSAEEDLGAIVSNIEANLRANIDVDGYGSSGTSLAYGVITAVDFKYPILTKADDSAFNRSANITAQFKFLLT